MLRQTLMQEGADRIVSAQRPNGAIPMSEASSKQATLYPGASSLAAIGLCHAHDHLEDGRLLNAVDHWIQWLIPYQDSLGGFPDFVLRKRWMPLPSLSWDGTAAALFVCLVAERYKKGRSAEDLEPEVRSAVQQSLTLLMERFNGLRPKHHRFRLTELLEVFIAVRAGAWMLERTLIDSDIAALRNLESSMRNRIWGTFWDAEDEMFHAKEPRAEGSATDQSRYPGWYSNMMAIGLLDDPERPELSRVWQHGRRIVTDQPSSVPSRKQPLTYAWGAYAAASMDDEDALEQAIDIYLSLAPISDSSALLSGRGVMLMALSKA